MGVKEPAFCLGECKRNPSTKLSNTYWNTVPDPTRHGFPYIIIHDLTKCLANPRRIEGYLGS